MDLNEQLLKECEKGELKIVKFLVENGANIEIKDNNGMTPLSNACRGGYLDVVKFLIENGANIETKDVNGMTPLLKAISLDVVKFLVEKGANIMRFLTMQNG